MSMTDPNKYSITCRLERVDDEDIFVARVLELPDVVGYGETRGDAAEAALDAIQGLQELAADQGRDFPEPQKLAPEDFSGRVTLRMSSNLHWQVSVLAQQFGTSLNAYLCEAVAERVGRDLTPASSPNEGWPDVAVTRREAF
jgi:predicted HicB family RNase H-like nuclease